jgi:hypothetical protein
MKELLIRNGASTIDERNFESPIKDLRRKVLIGMKTMRNASKQAGEDGNTTRGASK